MSTKIVKNTLSSLSDDVKRRYQNIQNRMSRYKKAGKTDWYNYAAVQLNNLITIGTEINEGVDTIPADYPTNIITHIPCRSKPFIVEYKEPEIDEVATTIALQQWMKDKNAKKDVAATPPIVYKKANIDEATTIKNMLEKMTAILKENGLDAKYKVSITEA